MCSRKVAQLRTAVDELAARKVQLEAENIALTARLARCGLAPDTAEPAAVRALRVAEEETQLLRVLLGQREQELRELRGAPPAAAAAPAAPPPPATQPAPAPPAGVHPEGSAAAGELRERAEAAEAAAEQARGEAREARAELDQVRGEARADLDAAAAQLAQGEAEREALRAELAAARGQLAEAEGEAVRLRAEGEAAAAGAAAAAAERLRAEAEAESGARSELQRLQQELTQARAGLRRAGEDAAHDRAAAAKARLECDRLQQELARRAQDDQQLLVAASAEIDRLRGKLSELERDVSAEAAAGDSIPVGTVVEETGAAAAGAAELRRGVVAGHALNPEGVLMALVEFQPPHGQRLVRQTELTVLPSRPPVPAPYAAHPGVTPQRAPRDQPPAYHVAKDSSGQRSPSPVRQAPADWDPGHTPTFMGYRIAPAGDRKGVSPANRGARWSAQ
eukprot:TRINITY_DN5308_c0_g1_i1.p1 TRINITY_DN5308_c0_g1~~TRINITY_DN5308_c0_g1_i1.p1  ORF type:complete len:477 (+),score=164.45 TRINITY_DN5308_c0_g1_i1:79-1431(+)